MSPEKETGLREKQASWSLVLIGKKWWGRNVEADSLGIYNMGDKLSQKKCWFKNLKIAIGSGNSAKKTLGAESGCNHSMAFERGNRQIKTMHFWLSWKNAFFQKINRVIVAEQIIADQPLLNQIYIYTTIFK